MAGVDPAEAVGDLLGAGDLKALALLDRAHELGRLEQAVVGPGIEPGVAPAHPLDPQPPGFQVALVDVGDLELAAR